MLSTKVVLTPLDVALADFLQHRQPLAAEVQQVCWLLAALTSHAYGQGHACLDVASLPDDLRVYRPGESLEAEGERLAQAQGQTLPPCSWWQDTAGNSPLVAQGKLLYLRRNWQAEQQIIQAIGQRLAQDLPVPDGLSERLASLFVSDAASLQPDLQKVACAMAVRAPLTLITGGPGTGKTTTVVRLLALLQALARDAGERPLHIQLAAPTGKAAARLGQSISGSLAQLPADARADIPAQAVTLHRLLASAQQGMSADVVVVDEASMIDLEMMARLLAAVPVSSRLILLGDKDQLASVEAGAVMGQLCATADQGLYNVDTLAWLQRYAGEDLSPWAGAGAALAQQTVMLRHSRRFDANSGIGQWARAVNAGQVVQAQQWWPLLPLAHAQADSSSDVSRLAVGEDRQLPGLRALVRHAWQPLLAALQTSAQDEDALSEWAAGCLAQLGRFGLLCALREGPWGLNSLNQQARRWLGLDGLQEWYAGRPVMVTRNDYTLNLMNGDVGLCLHHPNKGLRVVFASADGGGVRWLLPSRLSSVETAFAMTVHKSQGSEFDQVVLVLPEQSTPVLTRELVYTGITRARSRLTLAVPNEQVLWQAIARRVQRAGGLSAGVLGLSDF